MVSEGHASKAGDVAMRAVLLGTSDKAVGVREAGSALLQELGKVGCRDGGGRESGRRRKKGRGGMSAACLLGGLQVESQLCAAAGAGQGGLHAERLGDSETERKTQCTWRETEHASQLTLLTPWGSQIQLSLFSNVS